MNDQPDKTGAARRTVAAGALLAFLGVAFGAFGSHALRGSISADAYAVFRTGAEYHLIHALGLVVVGLMRMHYPSRLLAAAAWLMGAGVILFSGSLYLIAWTDVRTLGIATPFGGLCFLSAWTLVAVSMWPRRKG